MCSIQVKLLGRYLGMDDRGCDDRWLMFNCERVELCLRCVCSVLFYCYK